MRRQDVLGVIFVLSLVLLGAYVLWGQTPVLTCTAGPQVGDHCTKDPAMLRTGSP